MIYMSYAQPKDGDDARIHEFKEWTKQADVPDIYKIVQKCGKYTKRCKHTSHRVTPIKVPTSMFDMETMSAFLLDPTCASCISAMDDYSVVSYAWGECVEVDGFKELLPMKSLQSMLETLVSIKDMSRYIWIDALCIDQDSDEDKKKNLPLMSGIYTNCRCCYAFAGLELEKFVNKGFLDDKQRSAEVHYYIKGHCDEPMGSRVGYNTNTVLSLMRKILRSAWFTRVWTVQEYLLPRILYFVTKDLMFNKEDFVDFISNTTHEYWNSSSNVSEYEIICDVNECLELMNIGENPQAITILNILSNRDTGYQHDRVYGILALFPRLKIDVEYTKPLHILYKEFQLALLESGDISVLLINGTYYTDLQWACYLGRKQYETFGGSRHVIMSVVEVLSDKRVEIYGQREVVKDIKKVDEIFYDDDDDGTGFVNIHVEYMHEEEYADNFMISPNINPWVEAKERYVGHISDTTMFMLLDRYAKTYDCIHLTSNTDGQHYWIIYDGVYKVGVGVTHDISADNPKGMILSAYHAKVITSFYSKV